MSTPVSAPQVAADSPAKPSRTPANRYLLSVQYQDAPIPWDPYTGRGEINEHTDYFGGVFQAMERHLNVDGLTICFTWRLDQLPCYGPDVVAVVMGDEWGRYPRYTHRVGAVFKMLGTDYPLEATPFQTSTPLTAVTAAKYLRTQLFRMPSVGRAWRDKTRARVTGASQTPVFDIPMGYADQDSLPMKPFDERAYDLYFSGSFVNQEFPWYAPQTWLRTPKDVARSEMADAMQVLAADRPDLRIEIDARQSYVPQRSWGGEEATAERSYSEMMMDTRICPVPRGTRLETSRLYEALRSGCIIVSEPLPDRWYTRDLPALVLHDWAELPDLVKDLVADPDRMEKLHHDTRRWWNTKCSEAAVGRFMAERLNQVLDT